MVQQSDTHDGNNAIDVLNDRILSRSVQLYGREDEQETLTAVYNRFQQRILEPNNSSTAPSELILIHGASGTGKSALVEHSLAKMSKCDGFYYVTSAFDQLMHLQQPHSAFVDVLTAYIGLIQERNEIPSFRRVMEQLNDTIEEIDILVKMIPSLTHLMLNPAASARIELEKNEKETTAWIGSHNSKEATSRFKYAFRQFLRAISTYMGPTILVLEDVHRSDQSALDLLSSLLCDSTNHGTLFVATYRDDCNAEGLDSFLKKVPSHETTVTHIQLQNLNPTYATTMIKDLLQIDTCGIHENVMIDFVLKQTKGNPYFILVYLRTLVEDGLLRYDRLSIPPWKCDTEEIRAEFGETIADVMRRKISLLPLQVLQTLRFASFLGSKISVEILSHLVGASHIIVVSYLQIAAENGLLVLHSSGVWSFSHDSIQEATMRFVPDEEQDEFHYQIGRQLWKCFDIEKLDDNIFVVVGQLIAGKRYIVIERERIAVAKLCLRAVERSVYISSFQSAFSYVQQGIHLLGPEGWRNNYELTLELYNAAAELAYCSGSPKTALELTERIAIQARCFEDSFHGHAMKVRALGSIGNMDECLDFGLKILANLGEKFPVKSSVFRCYVELQLVRLRVRRKTSESLLRLPAMTNERKLAAVHILNQLFMNCCQHRPYLAPLLGFRVVSLTLDYGISPTSSLGFVALGAILSG
jgi:histidine kinase